MPIGGIQTNYAQKAMTAQASAADSYGWVSCTGMGNGNRRSRRCRPILHELRRNKWQ
jgi:hypothetical protein